MTKRKNSNGKSATFTLPQPGYSTYNTPMDVVTEYFANKDVLMQMALKKTAPIREAELRKNRSMKSDGIKWCINMDLVNLVDGYSLAYELEHDDRKNSFKYHLIKECNINNEHLTLAPIVVEGFFNEILVLFNEEFLNQLSMTADMDISNLLQFNAAKGIRYSKLRNNIVKNEVIWEFYGGIAEGRMEDGCCVFHRFRKLNITPVSEFAEYINKMLGIKL